LGILTSQVYEEEKQVPVDDEIKRQVGGATRSTSFEKKKKTNNRLMKIIVRAKIKSTARTITIYLIMLKSLC